MRAVASSPAADGSAGAAVPTVRHDTFVVERDVPAPAAAVFGAFADTPVRRRWFRLPGRELDYRHEFAVPGEERVSSVFDVMGAGREHLVYESRYLDIVADTRIVYTYTSSVDAVVRWASLVTVEFAPADGGSRLRWTEQAAFLVASAHPEHDLPHLRGALGLRLNGLAAVLRTH
ncbi:MAG: hypothetical protein HOV66_22370 [Streptomycetaceae bacterium]|jgi:uncharacterized protein YndB with AHSA1/START domain|nr:hypothetical protein [Streptomycetaceae bacterium]NUS57576.1 hypothetical protein [Streptomycetaceae bacterium]